MKRLILSLAVAGVATLVVYVGSLLGAVPLAGIAMLPVGAAGFVMYVVTVIVLRRLQILDPGTLLLHGLLAALYAVVVIPVLGAVLGSIPLVGGLLLALVAALVAWLLDTYVVVWTTEHLLSFLPSESHAAA